MDKMCSNDDCTLNYKCVRYLAMPELEHQVYIPFKQNEDYSCDNFIELPLYPSDAQEN